MKRRGYLRTRRQLFRVTAAAFASVPILTSTKNRASAQLGPGPGGPPPLPGGGPPPPPGGGPPPPPGGSPPPGGGPPDPPGPACFLKGTRISTPSGECPVEKLQIGDEVLTLNGRKAVKWIGYTKFQKEIGRAWQGSAMPIRVARFAIDDHTPHQDLYLSPAHCLFLNGFLIPVTHLVNDTSIAPHVPLGMSEVEYYHLEFDMHEVIYAEGALVESLFVDGSDRESFPNFVQYERLYGRERHSRMVPFAPVLAYRGGRDELKGLIRSLVSTAVDVRDPIQVAHDQLAERAETLFV